MKFTEEELFIKLDHTIETQNFILRDYKESDKDQYAQLFFQAQVMEAVGGSALENMEQFMRLLAKRRIKKDDQTHIEYLILSKENHTVLGEVGIKFKYIDDGILELSYLLKREYWGKGIITECVKGLLSIIYDIDENLSVQGQCREDNIGSQKVLDKCGFTFVGIEVIGEDTYMRFEHQKEGMEKIYEITI
jgi:ribosomal-protein-alanine N-acetyltransferase